MELKFGTHIYTVKDTHWKKFSSLDYGSVRGTGTRATKTYDIFQLPSLENRRVFLSLSTFFKITHNLIYFPVNFHPTRLSSCLRINNIVFLLHTQISLKTHFYLTLFLYGTIYCQKLLIVPVYRCLSIIPCHFFCNVIYTITLGTLLYQQLTICVSIAFMHKFSQKNKAGESVP